MRQDIEKYELIEKYLNGQLAEKEVSDVEKRMNEDPSFAYEVAQHQKLNSFIDDASMLSLKENLQSIHQKYRGKPRFLSGKKWLWGIPILIILSISLLLNLPIQKEVEYVDQDIKEKPDKVQKHDAQPNPSTVQTQEKKEPIQVKEEQSLHLQIKNQPLTMEAIGSDSAQQQRDETILPAASLPSELEPLEQTFKEDKTNDDVLPEPPEQNSTSDKTEPFDCSTISIEAQVKTEESCKEKPTGLLYIVPNSIVGGSPPYSLALKNQDEYSNQLKIDKLASNYYSVYIKDKNNCISHLGNFYIDAINCNYEAVFAPDKGEIWEIPEQKFPGQLKIFNKAGQIIYRVALEPESIYEWNGRTEDGSELPMGAYMFVIEINNQEPFWGTVTLVR